MLAFLEFFYQDRFINEFARKKKAKISETQIHGVSLVRYRRTNVLKNIEHSISENIGLKLYMYNSCKC